MKEFPKSLHINNKDKFKKYFIERIMCYLRKYIYDHILKYVEDEYFDLDKFYNKFILSSSDGNKSEISEINIRICKELNILGWKTKLAYGDTALFIYSESLPISCWDP
jgi:hypothetical protein